MTHTERMAALGRAVNPPRPLLSPEPRKSWLARQINRVRVWLNDERDINGEGSEG